MKTRLVTSLLSLALTAFVASGSSAQASLVAGWDFSQYAGDGFMSIDGGSSFTNTLSANYSDLDPTFGAGFESAALGTMYADGSFGSTPVAAGSGSEEFLPSAAVGGSLLSNFDAPLLVDFDAFSVLASEGQVSTESLAMIAPSAVSVVFEADLSGMSQTGSNWALTFAGRTFSGTSSVAIEFSSDGTQFTSFGSANLSTVDSKFSAALGTASTALAYVRLTFSPVGADQPFIDNVAISADLSGGPTTTTTTTTVPTTTTTSTTTTVPGTTTTSTSTTAPASTTTSTSTTAPASTTTSTSTTAPASTTTSTSTTAPASTTTSTSTTAPASTTTSTSSTVPGSTTTSTSTTAPASTTTSTSTTVPGSTTTSTSTTAPASTTTSTSTTAPASTTTSTSTTAPASTTTSTSTTAPASTTTSTSTTAPGSTTTSTSSTVPGSTTTSTSSTVPGSTTTTTTLPSGLSGQFPFEDESTGSANTSLLNVDTSLGQVCLAGQVQAFDRTATPFNRSVTWTYQSIGTITEATAKKVQAEFASVSLTLEIVNLEPGAPVEEYDQTITTECKLKASLQKEGARDRVSLRCDLGENFAAFPGLTSELVDNVANASLKRVKVNTKKGKLKISTTGVPTDAELPISCGLGA